MVRCAGRILLFSLPLALGLLMRPYAYSGCEPPKEQFAEVRPAPAPFDADLALGYLRALCEIGPRVSGSEGMRKQQELLEKHFEKLGGKVEWQRFTARQRSQRAQ